MTRIFVMIGVCHSGDWSPSIHIYFKEKKRYNFIQLSWISIFGPLFIPEGTMISVLSIQPSVQSKFVNLESIQTNLVRAFQYSFYVNLLWNSLHSLDLYKRIYIKYSIQIEIWYKWQKYAFFGIFTDIRLIDIIELSKYS